MRIIILTLTLISLAFSSQYTFLVKEYDKEIELEAKIIAKIAKNSIKDKIKIFIPNISNMEKDVYSKYFTLADSCESSNFVFVKKAIDGKGLCSQNDKLFFTNNYRRLLLDKRFYGAFFWNKSRPNIVFIKRRLEEKSIKLPKSYDQFVENFDEK